jgi:hypothetical protein
LAGVAADPDFEQGCAGDHVIVGHRDPGGVNDEPGAASGPGVRPEFRINESALSLNLDHRTLHVRECGDYTRCLRWRGNGWWGYFRGCGGWLYRGSGWLFWGGRAASDANRHHEQYKYKQRGKNSESHGSLLWQKRKKQTYSFFGKAKPRTMHDSPANRMRKKQYKKFTIPPSGKRQKNYHFSQQNW